MGQCSASANAAGWQAAADGQADWSQAGNQAHRKLKRHWWFNEIATCAGDGKGRRERGKGKGKITGGS
eukprot:12652432-Prorocentrum_lima.AAC.1